MDSLLQDIRYGCRMLRKSPGFTAVAVLTLGLGIGANAAIFSLVNAVMLRPLPYANPDRLLFLSEADPQTGTGGALEDLGFSVPDMEEVERAVHSFDQIGFYVNTHRVYGNPEGSEELPITYATHGLLSALGVHPAFGNGFTAADDQAGGGHSALLSFSFWQSRFGGNPNVLGQTITIDGRLFTIEGVLPKSFWFRNGGAVWVPFGAWPWRDRADRWALYSVGRLKPGVSAQAAQGELDGLAMELRKRYPQSNALISMRALALSQKLVGQVRPALLLLLASVGFVLLIACVNVANLLLARASVRLREIAIRNALGARATRIVRQLLTESIILGLLGGAVGLALARFTFGLILRLGGDRLPRSATIDLSVLWFSLALSGVTGILFGLLPALRVARGQGGLELRQGRSSTAGLGRAQLRSMLMLAEVAISVVLLIIAGLLIKSFARLRGVDPGFNPHHLLSVNLSLPHGSYGSDADKIRYEQRALREVGTIPGVQAASMARALPTQGDDWSVWYWSEGQPQPTPGQWPLTYMAIVTPGYLSTLQIPLLAGRSFTEADNQDAEPVAMVNETFARRHWPHQNAIGMHVNFPDVEPGTRTVVGVIGDVKNDGLAASPHEQVFVPYAQPVLFIPYSGPAGPQLVVPNINLLCRTTVLPLTLGEIVKHKLQEVDPGIAVSEITTMDDVLNDAIADRHFSVVLLEAFSGLALLLAAVGIYGVVSFSVSQRTREIGIRMALGARLAQLEWMVVGAALKTVFLGLAAGAAASLLALRLISSLLFGIRYTDPAVILLTTVVLTAVGAMAAYLPARRAAQVDPIVVLRHE
jgi:putative ABC transport system permease protein